MDIAKYKRLIGLVDEASTADGEAVIQVANRFVVELLGPQKESLSTLDDYSRLQLAYKNVDDARLAAQKQRDVALKDAAAAREKETRAVQEVIQCRALAEQRDELVTELHSMNEAWGHFYARQARVLGQR